MGSPVFRVLGPQPSAARQTGHKSPELNPWEDFGQPHSPNFCPTTSDLAPEPSKQTSTHIHKCTQSRRALFGPRPTYLPSQQFSDQLGPSPLPTSLPGHQLCQLPAASRGVGPSPRVKGIALHWREKGMRPAFAASQFAVPDMR